MPDIRFTLAEHEDNRRLHLLLGDMNRHIRQIETDLGVRIHNRGSRFHIVSESARTLEQAQTLILSLYRATDSGPLSDEQIRHALVRTEDDCPGGGRGPHPAHPRNCGCARPAETSAPTSAPC